jgi:DNA repair protein RadA/Sms
MARLRTAFVCQQCGYQSPKWRGRCPDCGQWNSLVEELEEPSGTSSRASSRWMVPPASGSEPLSLTAIAGTVGDRFKTCIGEFDRVLGGGIVPGSVVLIGGDPGIGKSTLLLQALDRLGQNYPKVLYVSGEESPHQIKIRAERLGIKSDTLYILAETAIEKILKAAQSLKPGAIVVDSIQTVYTSEITSAPGSVSQLREAAMQLMVYAKQANIPTFIIGHVTKEGAIAGPRTLEHIVDTVLYFEGDKGHPYRILRSVKNRFGSTNEIGVFEMKSDGLSEVTNPSELFLAERPDQTTGSVVVSSLEGTRPILVELQSLVSPTNFGMPRRMAIGVDPNRVSLLLAVLDKRAGFHLQAHDVFINVVGGLEVDEPAVDLGIVVAIASSFREHPVDSATLVLGEIGLGGEIRAISQMEVRLREAAKMGFKRCLVPRGNLSKLSGETGLELIGVDEIRSALRILFS